MMTSSLGAPEVGGLREARETGNGSESAGPKLTELNNKLLHKVMPYTPKELAPLVREITLNSEVFAKRLQEGQLTDQFRGEVGERATRRALEHFGSVRKLRLVHGECTADFLLTLERPMIVGNRTLLPGQKVVVEVKTRGHRGCLQELRNESSHARRQLRDTMKREGADAAICALPRECQNYRALFEEVRADLKNNEGEAYTLWCGLPDDASIRSAFELARAGIPS